MTKFTYILCLFGSVTQCGLSLFIDGCPMSGCRPSGSFSIYLQVPRESASIKWISDFVYDPVPNPLGCVSDSVNIMCLSNGPFPEDKGYVSLFNENGTIKWRDRKLNFPSLPLLDNYGDVTGSDGNKLVHYDADGKSYHSIPCEGLMPIFSMALLGDSFLLLVSLKGMIVVRETNGVPVGSLTLNATLGGVNGTFLPTAQPVINDQRFYILTKFSPLNPNIGNLKLLQNQRLYAIDVHKSISNRITIEWFYDIPNKLTRFSKSLSENVKSATKVSPRRANDNNNNKDYISTGNASLMWNRYNNTIYIITSSSESASSNILCSVRDKGDDGEAIFQTNLDAQYMAMFVSDHCDNKCEIKGITINPKLWVVTKDSKLHQISERGMSTRVIDLNVLLNMTVKVTTKVSLLRNSDMDSDILIFGILLSSRDDTESSSQTAYIVAVDTKAEKKLWTVPIPGNMIARGQITGVSGTDEREKDQIIVYVENLGKSAKIISIA